MDCTLGEGNFLGKGHLTKTSHLVVPGGTSGKKKPPTNAGDIDTQVQSLGQEDPLEEGTATHSSVLAQRTP